MVSDELFEVTLSTRELRQILSALYVQDGDQALYRRLAQLDPQPIIPFAVMRAAVERAYGTVRS